MIWSAPLAWALAIAAALPIVAHLWSRKRPQALPFPTLRFLRAASPVSRRLQQVQDWPLLLLRLAIVLAICAAAAGPTLTLAWRQRAWHDRLHRVIVVDERVATSAARLVADEQRGAVSSTVLDDGTIAESLNDAVAFGARAARDTRTEIVFVWEGSTATLTRADLEAVPASVGIRLTTVSAPPTAQSPPVTTSIVTDATPSDDAASRRVQASAQTLLLPGAETGLLIRWPQTTSARMQGEPRSPVSTEPGRAMPASVRRALDDIAADVRVREAADRSRADSRSVGADVGRAGQPLAHADDLSPLLRGWFEAPRNLVIALDAAPASPLAWWSIVSARESLSRIDTRTVPTRWAPGELLAAQRDAPMPPLGTMPGGLDTRAAWAVALLLLFAEGAWRRRSSPPVAGDEPGAAASEAIDAA